MSKAHAILSPSGASRWIACPPSARLEQQFPDSSGTAAQEGTVAHSLGELILRYKTKQLVKPQYTKKFKKIEASEFYSTEMFGYVDDYSVFVLERFAEAQATTKDAILLLEQSLDLTEYIPEGFGTADATIIAEPILHIIDLKYGKGVPVSATENKQLMTYALGAYLEHRLLYDIQIIRMSIYQPRIDNYSTFELSVSELLDWAANVLQPAAALAFAGEGEYKPGDHCRFCRARPMCRATAEYNLELAKKEFKQAALLTDAEISDILDRADTFTSWLKSVQDHALDEALKGHKWPGYKLVEGRSVRVYSDDEKVAAALKKAGWTEDLIYNKKVKGIGDLEKSLGKAEFKTILGPLVIKPKGKPTLAAEDDKRPEWSSTNDAKDVFKKVLNDVG